MTKRNVKENTKRSQNGSSKMSVETIYGYRIEDLILFAQACRKQGVTEDDLKYFATNCECAYKAIIDEMDHLWRTSLHGMAS